MEDPSYGKSRTQIFRKFRPKSDMTNVGKKQIEDQVAQGNPFLAISDYQKVRICFPALPLDGRTLIDAMISRKL
jgi:hypothetical protein